MTTTTVANGNTVYTIRDETSSVPARRFAAALDRDHPAVDRIRRSVTSDVTVWLRDEADEHFEAPDGWEIVDVFVSSNGQTAVDVERQD